MTLAPEHVEDLRRSALSDDDMIATLHIEGVRPKEIPIKAAQSAYRLPYFNLDGSLNCFSRLRLIPPVNDQKYYQESGSHPHLYVPPLVNWQSVAKNAKTMLTITEGEKKAACGCKHGLITAGIGGVWNWINTTKAGEKFTLPMLDEFLWTERPVQIVPDSDVWRPEKEQALRGFFALAKELQQRGALVQFVILPDSHGAKCGLDDFLLMPGHDLGSLEHLERVTLDEARFASLTAWWQSWREKHATQAAVKAQDAEELELSETAGLFTVRSVKHAVCFLFDRLAEQRGSVKAEVIARLGTSEVLPTTDLSLKSNSGKADLIRSLGHSAPNVPWKVLLPKACDLVLNRHRHGEPIKLLSRHSPCEPLAYTLTPIIEQSAGNIVFGDGGLGKSSLGLFWALQILSGVGIAGFLAMKGKPLYLDYEDSDRVLIRRIQAIAAAHPVLGEQTLCYQECSEPIWTMGPQLQRRIYEEHFTCIILDSLLPATGGDSGAEATTKAFNTIRKLKTSQGMNIDVLIFAHVAKGQQESTQRQTVYGSVFSQNYARNIWELKREQEIGSDTCILGLFHHKANHGPKLSPIGLQVTQNRTSTLLKYETFDLAEAAELEKSLPTPSRIRNLLEDGTPREAKEIAEELEIPLATVQRTLTRYKDHKWQMIGGAGKGTKWTVLVSKTK